MSVFADVQQLAISSPKRDRRRQGGWEGFFPYYAGYPEAFAHGLLQSANLKRDAVVLDPWNGSGTTVAAAERLGLRAVGFDINPVMVVVARARMVHPSEAKLLRQLAARVIQEVKDSGGSFADEDPLRQWFSIKTTGAIRALEEGIRGTIVADRAIYSSGVLLQSLSGAAATLYVALFHACKVMAGKFKSSNPTWVRVAREEADKVDLPRIQIVRHFTEAIRGMVVSLTKRGQLSPAHSGWTVEVGDATELDLGSGKADVVLTSPPYCTRIDYTAATRVELAVLSPLTSTSVRELAKLMTGSTLSPKHEPIPLANWGDTCGAFLDRVYNHHSKASSTYYYRTHLDYFDKMHRAVVRLSAAIRHQGLCVMVVQDSHYKEVHNDVPTILSEMASFEGLSLVRRDVFANRRSMSQINPGSKVYKRVIKETESVLCFLKE